MLKKLRNAKRGSRRDFDSPQNFSNSQRILRLPSARLVMTDKELAQRASPSVLARNQSWRLKPCSATLAALASSISLGMFTRAGHSRAHILQLTHRSATTRTSSAAKERPSWA